jgi:hypothetical protein
MRPAYATDATANAAIVKPTATVALVFMLLSLSGLSADAASSRSDYRRPARTRHARGRWFIWGLRYKLPPLL